MKQELERRMLDYFSLRSNNSNLRYLIFPTFIYMHKLKIKSYLQNPQIMQRLIGKNNSRMDYGYVVVNGYAKKGRRHLPIRGVFRAQPHPMQKFRFQSKIINFSPQQFIFRLKNF